MNHADGIHTIPVPRGWTVEQAWEHIKRGDQLPDDNPTWANVLIKNNRLAIHTPSTPEGGAR